MDLLRAGGDVAVTRPAKSLDGRKNQIDDRAVRHRAIHHGSAPDLVAGKPLLTVGAPGAGALVEIEVDLRSDFLEADSCNDIPLVGRNGLDISDFHTRSRPSLQGDVTSNLTRNRHAMVTKSRIFSMGTVLS